MQRQFKENFNDLLERECVHFIVLNTMLQTVFPSIGFIYQTFTKLSYPKRNHLCPIENIFSELFRSEGSNLMRLLQMF